MVSISADGAAKPLGPCNEIELPVWGGGREIGRFVVVMPTDSTDLRALERLPRWLQPRHAVSRGDRAARRDGVASTAGAAFLART